MRKFFASALEILEVALVAIVAVFLIRNFLVQPFLVSGSSMVPNFANGDYLLVDEITYRFRPPERGEVIVFKYPASPSTYFIKRIIGLPSETVEIKDNKVVIYNDKSSKGLPLDESYLALEQKTLGNSVVKLDDNEYYVLGDNRLQSSDSRRWGPVNKSLLTGKAFLRPWPFTRVAKIHSVSY